jgi:hypothetical protein
MAMAFIAALAFYYDYYYMFLFLFNTLLAFLYATGGSTKEQP